mgnify:CR=1 FL=1
MTKLVVDAWCWVEYLIGGPLAPIIETMLDKHECYTSAVSLAETASRARRMGKDEALAVEAIMQRSRLVTVDANLALEAGILHSTEKKRNRHFGLGDAFVLSTSKSIKGRILTNDKDFAHLTNVWMLDRLKK